MIRALTVALLLLSSCRGESEAAPSIAHTRAGDVQLTGRVVDRADLIPATEENALIGRLERLETDTTDQLVVVTLPSLNGASIEEIGKALGNGWGIGRADADNGVLLLVAPNERKVRIEVGLGLEGLMTDQKAATIVDDMLPLFRANNAAQAIDVGVDKIEGVLRADKRRPQRLIKRKAA